MATLSNCPLELCQRIFKYACTDDGTTGRSLSLVSKYIRDTSKPYKLQSISIAGADQATHFVQLLQRTPEPYRHVCYLSIFKYSFVRPTIVRSNRHSASNNSSSPFVRATTKAVEVIPGIKWYKNYKRLKRNVAHNVRCMKTNQGQEESALLAFLQILHLTVATLQTLNVDFQSRWKIVPVRFDDGVSAFKIRSMPALTSLTVHCHALFDSEVGESLFGSSDSASGRENALLPRVRYMDLAGFGIWFNPFDLYERIAKVAPSLTHLRLPMKMMSGLESALGPGLGLRQKGDVAAAKAPAELDAPISPPRPTATLLPVTLQRVYIQLSQPPGACCPSFEQEQEAYKSTVTEIRALEMKDDRVVVLDCGVCKGWGIEDVVRWDLGRGEGELQLSFV